MKKSTGLGRGLNALIDTTYVEAQGSSSINEIPLSAIVANPDQPRRHFDQEALDELAESIREHGVISPITLRKNSDDTYMIIAGERRYRASMLAGLETIPAYIRTAKDEQVMEWALIENIQREDLDAIEVALAYQRLMEEYHFTQEQMAEKVGKKRTTVANYVRLLHLPAEIQMGIKEHRLDMGHARALLGAESTEHQLSLYHRIQAEGLSVRAVEQLVKETPAEQRERERKPVVVYAEHEKALSRQIGRPVKVRNGKITISFRNEEELNAIIAKIS